MDFIDTFTDCIVNNKPIVYCKYGDGEHYCAAKYSHNINRGDCNCDNDAYTQKLSEGLRNSFTYITNQDNTFIAKWWSKETIDYWENIALKKVNWVFYHSLLFVPHELISDSHFIKKSKIYKAVKESKLKKIIVCNHLLIKSKILLNLDDVVVVPLNSWFDTQFDTVLNQVRQLIGEDGNHIVLTACGQSAKVLIAELHKTHPNGIYLDVGSGLDCICTKKETRGFSFKYEQIYSKFKEHNFIPDDWDDSKYDFIYNEASNKLGTHLGK